ncbi:MAG: lytic transglycosylase domain-containing protein [Halanaerobiales bacterium]|nr:lytic transglycosylase domain-containing protein [Halanaerobiales bacterium]
MNNNEPLKPQEPQRPQDVKEVVVAPVNKDVKKLENPPLTINKNSNNIIKILYQNTKNIHGDTTKIHEDTKKIHSWSKFFLVAILIFFAVNITLLIWMLSGGNFHRLKQMRVAAARYELIEPRAEYSMLLRETKMMERGLRSKLLLYGKEYNISKRLTSDEFEQYVTILYIYKIIHGINVNLIRANTASESLFNTRALSSAGARGVNQLMMYTFKWVNNNLLYKYDKNDIWDVYDNTEACLQYWLFNKKLLASQLKRKPKSYEMAWAYNCGATEAIKAIVSGKPSEYLSKETVTHGKKVMFYYKNYRKNKYNVYWEEQFYKKDKK